MANRLKLPEELESLIEKREQEDRRKKKDAETVSGSRRGAVPQERRRGKGRRKEDR
jgi:hypothetical protein